MPDAPLSKRGARAASTPLRIDYEVFLEAMENRYDVESNPDGALPLNVAENRLSWPALRDRVGEITSEHTVPEWVAGYAPTRGAPDFLEAAAAFLGHHLAGCPIDPERLATSAGATSVIEMTSFILADAGDIAVIPAPCYPVYSQDLGNLSGVERHDLVTHHDLSEIADGPILSIEHLDEARETLLDQGRRFRLLILTTPDNPTGLIYDRAFLERAADWCIARGVHLIVNEIYGLSLIDTEHPELRDDYRDPRPFSSFAQVMADRESDYLHLWYALSKDLGISGFRIGFLHSHNDELLEAYENLNLTHSVSNHTQWLLSHLLADADFMTRYLAENRARLTTAYARTVGTLRRLAIPYVPSRGSLFVWVDLSEFLEDASPEGELVLWREIFDSTGVLLTPGHGFGHSKHGLFRVVYPSVVPHELDVALHRLEDFVTSRRQRIR